MTVYNKLVRDKIPEILDSKGLSYLAFKVGDQEMMPYLKKKLFEEVEEFSEEPSINELADIQEVIYALLDELGHTREHLEQTRREKELARGAFSEKWILGEVLDD